VRRRSRRFAITAIIVVVLLGGLWWLTRPRIDPRFVGRWQWFDLSPFPYIVANDSDIVFVLSADGTARHEGMPASFNWYVASNGRLVIAHRFTGLDRIKDECNRFVERITGSVPVVRLLDEYNIREVTADRIELEYGAMLGSYCCLKRVSPADPVR
jgi:hypothetical protein